MRNSRPTPAPNGRTCQFSDRFAFVQVFSLYAHQGKGQETMITTTTKLQRERARAEVATAVRILLEQSLYVKPKAQAEFILAGGDLKEFERLWNREIDRRTQQTKQQRIASLINKLSSMMTNLRKGDKKNERQRTELRTGNPA